MNHPTELDADRRDLSGARKGDRRALEQLLRRHQPMIYAVCRRIVGNDADALDATQDALISIVRGLPRFDSSARFSTWAYRIATNASLDELRRRGRRPALSAVDSLPAEEADLRVDDPGEVVASQQEVDQALVTLTPEFRAAVVLRDLCQLDYAEIAEVLDIAPGTVRSRIARGRAQLADHLRGNQDHTPQRPSSQP